MKTENEETLFVGLQAKLEVPSPTPRSVDHAQVMPVGQGDLWERVTSSFIADTFVWRVHMRKSECISKDTKSVTSTSK